MYTALFRYFYISNCNKLLYSINYYFISNYTIQYHDYITVLSLKDEIMKIMIDNEYQHF